jgi:glycosyltransferase involved in cell wall biosynthesis
MRGEYLNEILHPEEFFVIDTDIPIDKTARLFRSFGWRYYYGPLIDNVNRYIINELDGKQSFDIIWIDKGVFIDPAVLKKIKGKSGILIHFTPDTAFTNNHSNLFDKGLPLYDYNITTKSFEIDDYKKAGACKVLYCTQGYDLRLHKPYHTFEEKEGICFVGLNEPLREKVIASLLNKDILVKLAGAKWERFVKRNFKKSNLEWYGKGLFGPDYAKFISGSLMGLGLLSKKFPELHTTRTFEIPACGTALVTESNKEINQFYTNDEVIFFTNEEELPDKVCAILENTEKLRQLSGKGYDVVTHGHYDYRSILSDLLKEMNLFN